MDYALLSLLVLVFAIAAAFIFKVNTGVVSIAVALLIGKIAGIEDKTIVSWFNSSLFIMLLGVMYLFCIAQENRTLELLAKKTLALCRGKVKLFPVILFLLSAILSAIGPGLISVTALMASLAVALARQTDTDPIRLLPFGTLGSFAGGLSPITPSGIVAISVAEKSGIMGLATPLFWKMALTNVLFAVILFFVFGWHKKSAPQKSDEKEEIPPFSLKQYITLGGIIVTALLTAVFGINVGLAAFAVSAVLTVFGCADEGAAMKKVPWNTLLMITGVGILISMVTSLGGIDLLSEGLSDLMGKYTAAPIITVLSGMMSWVSSASGVVMPTLIPTVPALAAGLEGASALSLTVSICIGAHLAALSPLSSCGALMLSAYSSSGEVSAKERNSVFAKLFLMSLCGVVFGGLLAFTGLY